MLPTTEPLASQVVLGSGALLTGDLGLVALKALLENGVGYVASSWRDRPTPIDAAIDELRDSVLQQHGVTLRRLRALSALESMLVAPPAAFPGDGVPRGAVVFAGRRGMRGTLEQFVRMGVPGAVVGICFDEDAARIADAVVIDPEPTPAGLVRAIDQAFAASLATRNPALVLVRERLLGMRGTIRCRDNPGTRVTAAVDRDRAERRAPADVLFELGVATVERPAADATSTPPSVVYVAGPLLRAARRALDTLHVALPAGIRGATVDHVALVSCAAPGCLPAGADLQELLEAAPRVLVLGAKDGPAAARVLELASADACTLEHVRVGQAHGDAIVAAITTWIASDPRLDDDVREVVAASATVASAGVAGDRRDGPFAGRIPRREEVLHRAVAPPLAAGLVLAQGVIGVPTRLDPELPSWRTDTGVCLTVASAAAFVESATGLAPASAGHGVYVISDGLQAGVVETAGTIGASIEHVDGTSPRSLGRAIAVACRTPRSAPHVIVATQVQRVAPPRRAHFGVDPDLLASDRLATSAVPTSATTLVATTDDLAAGPVTAVRDCADVHPVLGELRQLTSATWDLRPGARPSRLGALGWSLRRRMLRMSAGVDL